MGLIDLKDFEDLLTIQNNTKSSEETITNTRHNQSADRIKEHIISQHRQEIESRYKPEDLPEDYFFSALAELVLGSK